MDFLNTIRDFFRENPRMWFAVGGAVIIAGLVVWLVYGQSSIQFSQFFAASNASDPNQCFSWDAYGNGDGNFAEMNGSIIPGIQNYHLLSYQGHYKNNCDYPVHLLFLSIASNKANTYQIKITQSDFDPSLAFTRAPLDISPHTSGIWKFTYNVDAYNCGSIGSLASWRFKDFPNSPPDVGVYAVAFSYSKDCGASGGGKTTPTPTPTPAVSTAPVVCTPSTQTIAVGQTATLQATGGNGTFSWDVTGGGVVQSGGNETVAISYSIPGTKTVRVNSGTASAFCTIQVPGPTPTATPVSGGTISVQKTVRDLSQGDVDTVENLTVTSGMTAQFVIDVKSLASAPLANILVKDVVPPGMSYQVGSTYVEGQPVSVDTVTTSGLSLGTLQPGEEFTVRWAATADRVDQLVTGIQESRPPVTITASGIQPVSDDVTLEIQGTGTGQTPLPTTSSPPTGVGGVQTGPGDAVLIAFLSAAALTLLYSAYTRSPGFVRKEAEKISHDQDPLDFRS